MREWWLYGSRSAGMRPAEWLDRHGVDCSIEIIGSQVTAFCEIDHGVGKSGSGENRSRDLPSLQQVIEAAAVEDLFCFHLGFARELWYFHFAALDGKSHGRESAYQTGNHQDSNHQDDARPTGKLALFPVDVRIG